MLKTAFLHRLVILLACWAFGATGQAQYVGPYKKTMRFRVYGQNALPISAKESRIKLNSSEGKIEEKDSLFSVTTRYMSPQPAIQIQGGNETMEIQILDDHSPAEVSPVWGLDFRPGKFEIPERWAYLFSDELRSYDLDNRNLGDFKKGQVKEPIATAKIESLSESILDLRFKYWMDMEQQEEGGKLFLLAATEVKGNQSHSKGLLYSSENGKDWTAKPLDVDGKNLRSDHLYVASDEVLYIRVRESNTRPTVFYRSDDAGDSWVLDEESERLEITDMYFLSPKGDGYCFASKGNTTQLYQRDSNDSAWNLLNEFEEAGLHLLYAHGEILYLYQVGYHKFLQSPNEGINWVEYEPKNISPSAYPHHRFFRFQARAMHQSFGVLFNGLELGIVPTEFRVRSWGNRSIVFLDRASKYVVASGDGGETWSTTPLDLNEHVIDLAFLEPRKVLLVGSKRLMTVSF